MKLKRHTFTTSRDLEFFEVKTLQAVTGHPQDNFDKVILKELIDNALDACEQAEVTPQIGVELSFDIQKVIPGAQSQGSVCLLLVITGLVYAAG